MTKKKTRQEVIVAYKGFDANMQCRGFQYEVGKTYKHKGKVATCESGFHACEYPLDVFGYYAPSDSKYCIVEQSGEIARHSDDSKIASSSITIRAEIKLPELVTRAVEWILAKVDFANAPATNTGDRSAATNTGNWSAATNTGYQSAATNTGNWSAATNTGDWSAATNTGKDGVALASGYEGRVMGAKGCALFLVERDDNYKIVAAWAGIVGRDGIKPDVFYTLKGGKPVEVTP